MPSPCLHPDCRGLIPQGYSECPECKTNLYSPELAKIVRVFQRSCLGESESNLNNTYKLCLLQGIGIICDVLNRGYCPSCNKIHQNPCWYIDDNLKKEFAVSKLTLERLLALCMQIDAKDTGVEFLRDELLRIPY